MDGDLSCVRVLVVHLGDGDVYIPKFDVREGSVEECKYLELEANGDDLIDLDVSYNEVRYHLLTDEYPRPCIVIIFAPNGIKPR